MSEKRIGIFAGSFDPVHKGHLNFALQAQAVAGLEMVYFLPEIKPRRKPEVSHISHRVAMLKLATEPYHNLKVLELPDKQFLVSSTFPRLKKRFKNAQLFLVMGDDVVEHLASWPLASSLLSEIGLIVSARKQPLDFSLPVQPKKIYLLDNPHSRVSSSQIREAASRGKTTVGSLASVDKYIKKHWLYQTIR